MTEKQIKEMLDGIINNGEKWECRPIEIEDYVDISSDDWQPYKLGDEIHADWEYRKIKTWFVYGHVNNFKLTSKFDSTLYIWHKGTKEECEKWIEEHTNKSWLEERKSCLSVSFEKKAINCYESGATEVCKKILEEADNRFNHSTSVYSILEDIIKELGIKL